MQAQAFARLLGLGMFLSFWPSGAETYAQVVWLRDSSGFLYVTLPDEDGEIPGFVVQHDVSRGRRWMARHKGLATVLTELSPDGNRIAIGSFKDTGRLQIVIYDLNGKEIHRSPDLQWTKDIRNLLEFYWSPKKENGKLLIYDFHPGIGVFGPSSGSVSLYDTGAKTMKGIVDDVYRVKSDQQGLLVAKEGLFFSVGERILVDWNGETRKMAPGKEAENRNPDDGTRFLFPDRGAAVRVVFSVRDGHSFYHLEIQKPGETKHEIAVEKTTRTFSLNPSPDKKFLAIRVNRTSELREAIEGRPVPPDEVLIIDAKGDVMHRFPAFPKSHHIRNKK